ncbi:carboxypeptidase-like regulatory domain-containing protein [Couchioplanes caeruleus]|uniref:carboxypeptidase-like regulatory domain-containing protein n=1 Tax=Couchioplanes caeruleus TaxID=56438 RepID=UPI0020BE03C9|nr:carboxypeptidase-like regulatory domain-containing protein [Couchioplanes caeruleus]UQU62749.1 carboxypeptidase-like regulatory domain-containing protein [Couchioplanes caeruleus]
MTTRVRARWARAAALTALAGTALAVSAAPVAAAPPAIRIESVSSDRVQSGEPVRVRFRATNNARRIERVFVAVSGGLRCTAGCSAVQSMGPGRSQSFDATLVAPQVNPGEETGLNLAVSVRVGTQTAFDHKMIFVSGAERKPAPVSRVSGRVRDATGTAIPGAALTVRDSAGHEFRTSSGKGGKFSIKSSDSRPIAPGRITIVAGKDGYRTASATVQAAAGGAATVRLILAAVAKPSPTPATATTNPPAVADLPATDAGTAATTPPAAADTAGDGNGTLLLTLLGGLLIAAGLGALVLLVIRRRSRPDDPDALPVAPTRLMPQAGTGHAGTADAPTALLPAVRPDSGHPGPHGGQFR